MSSTYAGNAASYPANITIPSDGDARDAASVNVALEGLADRTAHLDASRDDHETRLDLARPQWANTSGVMASIAYLGADVNVTLLTTPHTTVVGDTVHVSLGGRGRISKAAGTAGAIALRVRLQANENGGGWVDIPQADVTLQAYQPSAGGIANELMAPVNIDACFDVATAGTLAIRAVFSFLLGTNASDLVDFQDARAALRIHR